VRFNFINSAWQKQQQQQQQHIFVRQEKLFYCINLIISGTNCQTNIDDCKLNDQPCQNGATCIDGNVDYTCNCMPGYTGRNCTVDIDECQFGFCQNNATCNHTINNYTCHCLPGFTDFNCSTNINECEPNPCVNSTNCTDLINDFNCTCLPGFTGNHDYEMKVIHCFDRNYVVWYSSLLWQELGTSLTWVLYIIVC